MPSEKLDDESSLPKATVDKLIQDLTPPGYSVNRDVRTHLRNATHTFLKIIALESNRLCDVEKKKTISASHVLKAIENHGFGEFVKECNLAAKNYDDYSRQKPSKQNKLNNNEKTMEELGELQKKLFKQAFEQQMREYKVQEEEDVHEDSKE
ncbi:negative cofactor 2 transcription regulator complex subunit ncb2 [Glugoides intestinalis]